MQRDFAASLSSPFPMIGDHDTSISRAYGVLWPIIHRDRRVTFVIDREGIVRGRFQHELNIGKHIDDVLELLGSLGPAA
jgi:peroxiredoxin Q/BCP